MPKLNIHCLECSTNFSLQHPSLSNAARASNLKVSCPHCSARLVVAGNHLVMEGEITKSIREGNRAHLQIVPDPIEPKVSLRQCDFIEEAKGTRCSNTDVAEVLGIAYCRLHAPLTN